MPSLRELQTRLTDALFDEDTESVLSQITSERGIDGRARLDIYRNNLREGFRKALALEFPVIEKLVGEAYFRQLALDFLRAHPSRSGDLHHIGEPFAGFLRGRFAETEYAYFPDVAALEWAYQEVEVAPDAPAIDLETLKQMDMSRFGELRFDLHPACRLVASRYPILRLWSSNQSGAPEDERIDLGAGGDYVLVLRTVEGTELRGLPPGEFTFLASLAQGLPLGEALEAAAADVQFDPGAALRKFVDAAVLVQAASESSCGRLTAYP